MPYPRSRLIATVILACCLLFCPTSGITQKVVNVGIYDNIPLVFQDDKGEASGFTVTVLREIAAREGWQLVFHPGSWPECMQWLEQGKTDIQVAIIPTPERKKKLDFTNEFVFTLWGQVYALPGKNIQSILDLTGKTIAVYEDSIPAKCFQDLLKRFAVTADILFYSDYNDIARAVESKKADAGVFVRSFGEYYLAGSRLSKTPILFNPLHLRYATRKGHHPHLITAIDRHLKTMKETQDSSYYKAIDVAFGAPPPPPTIPTSMKYVLAITLVAMLSVFSFNMLLQWQVRMKTMRLKKANRRLAANEKDLESELFLNQSIAELSHLLITFPDDFSRIAEMVLHKAKAFSGSRYGYVSIIEPATGDNVVLTISSSEEQAESETLPHRHVRFSKNASGYFDGLAGFGLQDRTPFFTNTPAGHPAWTAPPCGHISIHRFLSLPVTYGSELVGQIALANPDRDFTNEDFKQIERLGELYAIAIVRSRSLQEKESMALQLRQAQKMEAIGTLAGGIAHDFNNILGTILGYTEMVTDEVPPESPSSAKLAQIMGAALRARDLVRQILAFSRQSQVERIPVNPQPLCKEVVKLLRSTIPATITVRSNLDPHAGVVLADPTQLHQIFMNLCTNAFHAMENTGGTLTVTMQRFHPDPANPQHARLSADQYVELIVADTGPGIPPAILDRIFDPYFTTKDMEKGTGMGLAIVHGIVRDYEGEIYVESKEGTGTVFRIYLPVMEMESSKQDIPKGPLPRGSERILLVDDEMQLAEMGKEILEDLGYTVTIRYGSTSALETFRNDPDRFDLVVTDQTMPNRTGAELAQELLEIRPDLPIILCTGYSSLISEAEAKAIGIREFVYKPLHRENMAHLVRNALGSP